MRGLILIFGLLLPFAMSAQSLANNTSSVIEQGVDRYELVRVDEFGQALVKYEKYNEEGILIQDGYYSNGSPAGTWNMYNPVSNQIISTMRYDTNGNRLSLTSEMDNQKTTVKYEDDRPSRVKTRVKVQE
jgi:antitoxin component YwqK of YwqJK toxin-antitoxin module